MSISVSCEACGQRLKAKESLAGKRLPCPKCGEVLLVPQPAEQGEIYGFTEDQPLQPADVPAEPEPEPEPEAENKEPEPAFSAQPPQSAKLPPSLPPLAADETPLWLRHLHWLLALALVPLAFTLLRPGVAREDLPTRLVQTLEQASDEDRERIEQVLDNLKEEEAPLDKLFGVLPGHKLAGALLARKSVAHWGFAAGSSVLFLAFFLLLGAKGTANPAHLLTVSVFTATAGIIFLFALQHVAAATQGVWLRGGNVLVLLFYIVKLIGFSYQAALDPQNGFFLSFLGYTLGVGFCEEVVKAAPLLWHYGYPPKQTWRGAFIWGLASGAGFGIAEGIIYSANYYNGISGLGDYVVRFISCVALHALWTGSVGITLNQNQELVQGDMAWYEYLIRVLRIVLVPMVLHGLYDTLLKKEMSAWALAVAALSFVFLAFQISQLHGSDDREATADMLREYKRRKRLAQEE